MMKPVWEYQEVERHQVDGVKQFPLIYGIYRRGLRHVDDHEWRSLFRHQKGKTDMCLILFLQKKISNTYQKPETLPYNINTKGSEDGAFIALMVVIWYLNHPGQGV